jgi:hypothetical protein
MRTTTMSRLTRLIGIRRLTRPIGAATLAALAACGGLDSPTQPRNAVKPTPGVIATSSAGGSLTVTYCSTQAPIWAASQDGAGPWKRVMPTRGNTYTFSFPSGKGGVATVAKSGPGFRVEVVFATLADFGHQTTSTNLSCPGTKTVKGSVAHVLGGQVAVIDLGQSSAFLFGGGPTTFTLSKVQDGPRDLIATRDNTSSQANRIILRRGLNVANGGTLALLDFGASEAFAPASAKATVNGLPSGAKASVAVLFFSPRGTGASLFAANNVPAGTVPYAAIPTAKLLTSEVQLLAAVSTFTSGSRRNTGVFIRSVTNRTVTFGPALSSATVSSAASTPYYRPRIKAMSQSQYNKAITVGYSQASANRSASIFATAAYFGSAPATWDLSLPDLHTVSGFLTTWGPKIGQHTTWDLSGFGGTLPFFNSNPADGSTFLAASNSGSLTSH